MIGPGGSGGDGGTVGEGHVGAGGGGGVVVVVLPLSKSYAKVENHFRPILKFVPDLTSDAR